MSQRKFIGGARVDQSANKYHRLCSCGAEFDCNGECNIPCVIDSETSCFCVSCVHDAFEADENWFNIDPQRKCKSRGF